MDQKSKVCNQFRDQRVLKLVEDGIHARIITEQKLSLKHLNCYSYSGHIWFILVDMTASGIGIAKALKFIFGLK